MLALSREAKGFAEQLKSSLQEMRVRGPHGLLKTKLSLLGDVAVVF
jgi:hypothetical protein